MVCFKGREGEGYEATVMYKACQAGTQNCSNTVPVNFPQ